VFFFARGFMTFQATALLWQTGFWQDAAVLSRSLREASYQARWIAKRGDEASRLFFVDHERNRRKVMKTLGRVAPPEIKAQAQRSWLIWSRLQNLRHGGKTGGVEKNL
jgi:hypothetical protein